MLNQVILHCQFACQASPDDSDEHGTETKNEGAVSSTLRPRSEHFGNSAALKRSKLNTGAVRRRWKKPSCGSPMAVLTRGRELPDRDSWLSFPKFPRSNPADYYLIDPAPLSCTP